MLNFVIALSTLLITTYFLLYVDGEALGITAVVTGLFFLFSVIPIIISQSKLKRKNFWGTRTPLLFFVITLPFLIHNYYTCTGKFCEILPLMLGGIIFLLVIIFLLFYGLGASFCNYKEKKWNFYTYLSIIILLILIYTMILFVYH